jgi:succinate-acetate transporter protein
MNAGILVTGIFYSGLAQVINEHHGRVVMPVG